MKSITYGAKVYVSRFRCRLNMMERNGRDPTQPNPMALWVSLMLNAAIAGIWKVVNKPKGRKKVLCFFQLFRSAAYFYRILAFMGVDVTLFTANSSPVKRGASFN